MTGLARQTIFLTLAALAAVMLLTLSSKAWGQPAEGVIDEDSGDAPYAAGELIITYKPEAPGESVNGVGQRFEARTEETLPEIDARLLFFPEVKSEQSRDTREEDLEQIKETLEQNPAVESVDYNYVRRTTSIPDDPRFDAQYGLRQIKAPAAWNKIQASGEVDIAVVDTGIDSDHPDLRSKIEAQRTFLNGVETEGAEDDTGHGTHVAGIAAAVTDNGKGVAGACPGCDLLIAKTFANDDGYDSDVADGIVWATDNGAEVINFSFGGRRKSDALRNAVNYAWDEGVVVVAAAGSLGRNVRFYPAAYRNAIAVAATNKKDRRAKYSNYGGWVDLSAPGTKITSTYLSGGYRQLGGTSMSTPHVAGLAGLLAAQDRSAPKIRARMENTAVDRGDEGKDKYYGHGRINAYRAVKQ